MTENEKQQLVEAVIAELKANGTDVATADIVTNADGISYIIAYNKDGNIVRIAPSTMLDKNVITWINEGNNVTNMNDFTEAGIYELKGERTRDDDNLPFGNTGGGHTFHARLEVLDSSITPEGKSDDICITQKLTLSNRVAGDGDVYIRTGRGTSKQSITWETWGKLQQNIEVGEVTSLDNLIDNGIYSGVWTTGSFINTGYPTTFVCVVINDYFLGEELTDYQRKISQFVYGVTALDGSTGFRYRVKVGDNDWGNWEILNKSEIDSAFKNFRDGLELTINNIVAPLSTQIDSVKRNAAHYNKIGFNTRADEVELYVKNIADDGVRTDTIPAATNEKAGVMSAEDKNKLEDASNEIVKIKDGNTIVAQAREIHSRNGKNDSASFLARTTAGSGTIGDGVATLKSVGGNIVKNLVDGTFANVDLDGQQHEIVNDLLIITPKYATTQFLNVIYPYQGVVGHKYYCSVSTYTEGAIKHELGIMGLYYGSNNINNNPPECWNFYSQIDTLLQTALDNDRVNFRCRVTINPGVGIAAFRCPLLIDLTEMFGAGKEPTKEECDKLFATMDALPQGLSIANPTTFKSTGFNQFNPDNVLEGKAIVDNAIASGDKKIAVIPCLPCKVGVGENNGYCIHGEFGEDIKVYLTPLNPMEVDGELYMHELTKDATTDTYVPLIKGYMIVEVPTTANLCAHFLWSEDCDKNAYEPYYESVVKLPTIPEMSEYGLAGYTLGNNNRQDIINLEKGIYYKRIYSIDLGEQKWYGTDLGLDNLFVMNFPSGAKPESYGDGIIGIYSRHLGSSTTTPDKHCLFTTTQIYIRDSAISTATEMKSALQGVVAYYASDIVEYPLPKVNNNYTSSDYGVEQFDSIIPCNANNLYYMRSLAGETRNFLDRMYANTDKNDANEVADYITTNIAKAESVLRTLYIAAGAEYDKDTGKYAISGVTDLSEEEMLHIYDYKDIASSLMLGRLPGYNFRGRAFLPLRNHTATGQVYSSKTPISGVGAFSGTKIEVFKVGSAQKLNDINTHQIPYLSDSAYEIFNGCTNLAVVYPLNIEGINAATILRNAFKDNHSLVELRLYKAKIDLFVEYSPLLSKDSLLYIINNAIPTSAITITLHPDAYARLANDADIVAALAAQPLITLVSA